MPPTKLPLGAQVRVRAALRRELEGAVAGAWLSVGELVRRLQPAEEELGLGPGLRLDADVLWQVVGDSPGDFRAVVGAGTARFVALPHDPPSPVRGDAGQHDAALRNILALVGMGRFANVLARKYGLDAETLLMMEDEDVLMVDEIGVRGWLPYHYSRT